MDSIFNNSMMLFLILLFFFRSAVLTTSFTSTGPLCHLNECIALIEFKKSLTIDQYASSDPSAHNKLAYWELQRENNDCCSWESVECDTSTGHLPGHYFHAWNAMKSFHSKEAAYMVQNIRFYFQERMWGIDRPYSMTIENKGATRGYEKIVNIFVAIDLSSNNFQGEIPDSIGSLKGLELLNLANNKLTGMIPSSLGDLENLESLDISQNSLSGDIPKQLTKLTFLAFLNVSQNKLTGPIPKGKQFDTFQSNSYQGNPSLCGDPLSRKCENLGVPIVTPPPLSFDQDGDDSDSLSGVIWAVIGLGFASGLITGLVIGRFLCDWYYDIFQEKTLVG